MVVTGRQYVSPNSYRYGFNGKEMDPEGMGGSGATYDYGFRIYNPNIAKFLSVDPLRKNYPMLTPYQFASNTPIWAIDLDGLEATPISTETTTLIIIIQGYGGDPSDGATLASNAAKTNPGLGIDTEGLGQLAALSKNRPHVQVAVYASSTTENTKKDVLKTIQDFQKLHPNGELIIIGHSQGADNAIELLKENPSIKVDLLVTFDTQDAKMVYDIKGVPIVTGIDDNNVSSNVKHVINYYQTTESVGGEVLDFDEKVTKGVNINVPGSNHRSIDNDATPSLKLLLDVHLDKNLTLEQVVNESPLVLKSTPYNPSDSGSDNVLPGGLDNGSKKAKSR